MKEDFLHYLWKFKKFDFLNAKTTTGEELQVIQVGSHNTQNSGPDFFNAKLRIANQLWAGNVEIHLKSSDWYLHNHQKDDSYDNVILHVVWYHDVEVFRNDNTSIATFQLSDFASAEALKNYQQLVEKPNYKWINCEKDLKNISSLVVDNWMERLYVERLEQKVEVINEALKKSKNDWEAVCFQILAKNFGLNMNGKAFFAMAASIPFSVLRKLNTPKTLEALFFGLLNMFSEENEDVYMKELKNEFSFLQQKYKLKTLEGKVEYFRLRPHNFPTIRLAQLAAFYASTQNIFLSLIQAKSRKEIHNLFKVEVSNYWKTHFTFGKENKKSSKALSVVFIDLVIINSIVPLKFHFSKLKGNLVVEECFLLLREIPKEHNSLVEKFNKLRPKIAISALDSQAVLHLKSNYCDKNRCLHCAIGLDLLKNKSPM